MALQKNLKLIDVFSIATGSMISSGIFILPSVAFIYAGKGLPLSYLLGGIIACIGILNIAELSTAMPKAGGDYFFVNKALGPLVGTVSGFLSWFALSLKTAFAIFGLSELIHIYTGMGMGILAVILTAFFVILNLIGTKEAALFEVILVAALLAAMLYFIITGMPVEKSVLFSGFFDKGINGILSTTALIFVSFGGLLNLTSICEEIRNPKRNLPLGLVLSVTVVTILYVLMIIVLLGVLPGKEIAGAPAPIAEAARRSSGLPGYIIITAAALLAFVTTANAGLLSSSRYPMALSRDGLVPPFLAKTSKKKKIPVPSVLVTGIFIVLSLQLELETLAKSASAVILTTYILSAISVIILRESGLRYYNPSFKVPLYPVLPIITIVIFGFFLADLGWQAVEVSGIFVILSLLFYFFYGRRKGSKDFALLYLLKRVIDKRLETKKLDSELRDIIRFRDEIVDTRVDEILKEAFCFEINEHMSRDNFFIALAERASIFLEMEPGEILERMKKREAMETTAVTEFAAIPHIVIERPDYFHLILVRAPKGINFGKGRESVKAVFMCLGSRELRDLHIEVLAAIAKAVQKEGFQKEWLAIKDPAYLKEILLERNQRSQ